MSGICSGPTHYTVTFISDEMYSVLSQGCKNIKRSNPSHPNSERWPSPPVSAFSGAHDRLLRGNDQTYGRGFHGGESWNRGFPGCGPAHISTNVSEGTGASIFRAYMYRYGHIGGICSSQFSTLMMEATCSSENLVNHLTDFLGKFG